MDQDLSSHNDNAGDKANPVSVIPPDFFIDDDNRCLGTIVIEKSLAFFTECPVAGWHFHDLEDCWDELYVGAPLALVRQRDNAHDCNAVAVALADDYDGDPEHFDFDFILGYVPRSENEMIAKMLDMGWSDAFTAELTAVNAHGPYADRLRMTIYIQHKERISDEYLKKRLFVWTLNGDSAERFLRGLNENGYAAYFWRGEHPSEEYREQLPNAGGKVLFICRNHGSAALYLMHIVKKGPDAAYFFCEAGGMPDPRMFSDFLFVLTNVKGPIACSVDDYFKLTSHIVQNGGLCEYHWKEKTYLWVKELLGMDT